MTEAKPKVEAPANIYQLISKISSEAGALEPTSKAGLPFPFRGVDGVVNHLSTLMQKYGVIVVPEVMEHVVTPREIGNRVVKTTTVVTKFHFYAPDGTTVAATTAGLADDFGDRSTAQAQSVAFRIALLQTFTLPTQSPEPEQTGQAVDDELAKMPVTTVTKPVKTPTATEAKIEDTRARITALINAKIVTGPQVNEIGDTVTGKERQTWLKSAPEMAKVLAEVERTFSAEIAALNEAK